MPYQMLNGVRYHYQDIGMGQETIVFAHGVIMSSESFHPQLQALSKQYRCIAFDWRGHGLTEQPLTGYDVDTSLFSDAVALLQHLDLQHVHFVGVALGGFIGLRLALRHPEVLRSLTLLASAADAEPASQVRRLVLLSRIARYTGIKPFAGSIVNAQFAQQFLREPDSQAERQYWQNYFTTFSSQTITTALIHEVQHQGLRWDEIAHITTPTLIIHGDEDSAIDWKRAQHTAEAIPQSRFVILNGVGHSPTIEAPGIVNELLQSFIATHSGQ
jgi:pimeloyl-ACP methyl ester carboxylesterase